MTMPMTPSKAAPAKPAAIKKVNVDTATLQQLLVIPGVSNRWAREIMESRPYNGNVNRFRRELGK